MNGEADLVTVYRSADQNADRDAARVQDYLGNEGLSPVTLGDGAPGVVPGSYEVRVPSAEVAQAEELLANFNADDVLQADPSAALDTVPIVSMMGATGEIEAMGVKSVLDAAGVPSVLIGDSTLPNLEFHVRVARADVERAQAVLAEAREAGPEAAAEGAAASEGIAEPQV